MKPSWHLLAWLVLLLIGSEATPAWAVADCDKLMSVDRSDAFKQNPDDVHECVRRGYDAPLNWRRNDGRSSGVKVSGTGGLGLGVIQGPERSPGANGAPYSVGASAFNFALRFPPWAGFPCQLPGHIKVCGGKKDASDGTGNVPPPSNPENEDSDYGASDAISCPAETDTTGTFGAMYALSGGALPLACGGAIPLSAYQLTLQRGADHLAATEYGASYLWLYQQSGDQFVSVTAQPIKLPSYLCRRDKQGRMVKSVTLAGTTAQMTMYSNATRQLVLRLMPLDFSENPTAVNDTEPEKYLVIPVVNGTPQVPADCALESDYYMVPDRFEADIAFTDSITPLCEGGNCNPTTTTTPAATSCDTATIYPNGIINTSAGPIDCSTKIQLAVISRPNILFPPGTTPQTVPISGRSGVLVQSVEGSSLYAPSQATIRLGANAPAMVLPSGGIMYMADGGTLAMNGPATINPGNGQVTLTTGGEWHNAQGEHLQSFAAGSRIAPNIAKPMTINLERDMLLPAGYLLPTPPGPYVRLPVNAK